MGDKLRKCSNCILSKKCPIFMKIKIEHRRGYIITVMSNEEMELYSELFANICKKYLEREMVN